MITSNQKHKGTHLHTSIHTYVHNFKGDKVEMETFESQEKYPFLIEMAGSLGSTGGLGRRILSSCKNSSSRRFNETFAFTACQGAAALEAGKTVKPHSSSFVSNKFHLNY